MKLPPIIWISPRVPLPDDDGARRATATLLRSMTEAGAEIHLVSLATADEPFDEQSLATLLGVRSAKRLTRPSRARAQLFLSALRHPLLPVTVAPYATETLVNSLTDLISAKPNSLVIHDGLHAAGWMLTKRGRSLKSSLRRLPVFRPHNVEQDIWYNAAKMAVNPLLASSFFVQGTLIQRCENTIARSSGAILPVSDKDSLYFRKVAPNALVATIPIGLTPGPRPVLPTQQNQALNLLFIGRLDWRPNSEGLKWFLTEVWPTVVTHRPDLSLTIVGSGDGTWLRAFHHLPNINMMGRVESIEPFYHTSTAVIVPIFFGSGTRVKAIEAIQMGRACISTALGVEGLGLKAGDTYIRTESRKDWIDSLVRIDSRLCQSIAERALKTVSHRYDPTIGASKALALLHELVQHKNG